MNPVLSATPPIVRHRRKSILFVFNFAVGENPLQAVCHASRRAVAFASRPSIVRRHVYVLPFGAEVTLALYDPTLWHGTPDTTGLSPPCVPDYVLVKDMVIGMRNKKRTLSECVLFFAVETISTKDARLYVIHRLKKLFNLLFVFSHLFVLSYLENAAIILLMDRVVKGENYFSIFTK